MSEQTPLERMARALGAESMNCLPGEVNPKEWQEEVRAAILAIREPSEAMVEAGDEEEYLMNVESVPAGDRWRRVWQAMIDAALAE